MIDPAVAGKLASRLSMPTPTTRELEVLQLTARGHSNKEIAAGLHMSEPMVKAHLKSLFAKLDVLSRSEAVNIALRRGLIRLEEEFTTATKAAESGMGVGRGTRQRAAVGIIFSVGLTEPPFGPVYFSDKRLGS